MAKLKLYCACGNISEGEIKPEFQAVTFRKVWESVHSGSNCKPCSREEAIAAMAPEDRP